MKLGTVTKLYKKKITPKKHEDDVISENCDLNAIFSIYGQFGTTWEPDSGCRVYKIYVFVNSNLLSYIN